MKDNQSHHTVIAGNKAAEGMNQTAGLPRLKIKRVEEIFKGGKRYQPAEEKW